jgi:hypothetical protein
VRPAPGGGQPPATPVSRPGLWSSGPPAGGAGIGTDARAEAPEAVPELVNEPAGGPDPASPTGPGADPGGGDGGPEKAGPPKADSPGGPEAAGEPGEAEASGEVPYDGDSSITQGGGAAGGIRPPGPEADGKAPGAGGNAPGTGGRAPGAGGNVSGAGARRPGGYAPEPSGAVVAPGGDHAGRVASTSPDASARPAAARTSMADWAVRQGSGSPQAGHSVIPSCGPRPPPCASTILVAVRASTLSGLTYADAIAVQPPSPPVHLTGRQDGPAGLVPAGSSSPLRGYSLGGFPQIGADRPVRGGQSRRSGGGGREQAVCSEVLFTHGVEACSLRSIEGLPGGDPPWTTPNCTASGSSGT